MSSLPWDNPPNVRDARTTNVTFDLTIPRLVHSQRRFVISRKPEKTNQITLWFLFHTGIIWVNFLKSVDVSQRFTGNLGFLVFLFLSIYTNFIFFGQKYLGNDYFYVNNLIRRYILKYNSALLHLYKQTIPFQIISLFDYQIKELFVSFCVIAFPQLQSSDDSRILYKLYLPPRLIQRINLSWKDHSQMTYLVSYFHRI